jgi:hypothetical protein
MQIGTTRPEEAKVFDQFAGYHSFHAEETQEEYGSFEVFWHDGKRISEDDVWADSDNEPMPAGWYWWACFPGCMPDGDSPIGPFASSRQALEDADEWNPEFDD